MHAELRRVKLLQSTNNYPCNLSLESVLNRERYIASLVTLFWIVW